MFWAGGAHPLLHNQLPESEGSSALSRPGGPKLVTRIQLRRTVARRG